MINWEKLSAVLKISICQSPVSLDEFHGFGILVSQLGSDEVVPIPWSENDISHH